jgi:hypothetical protein
VADAANPPEEAPDGAAVFPLIPPELGVHPLLLAALHAYVLLDGSDPKLIHPAVAEEGLHYLVTYLQRLDGENLRRVREDFQTLVGFGKADGWSKLDVRFLHEFLRDNGIGTQQ